MRIVLGLVVLATVAAFYFEIVSPIVLIAVCFAALLLDILFLPQGTTK